MNKSTNERFYKWIQFFGKRYFGDNGSQSYLIFQPIFRKFITRIRILARKSKGLSEQSIKPPNTSDNSLTLKRSNRYNPRIGVKRERSFLKQGKAYSYEYSKFLYCL